MHESTHALVGPGPGCWLCFLADGQGGRSGGGAAARLARRVGLDVAVRARPGRLLDGRYWAALLGVADINVADEVAAGGHHARRVRRLQRQTGRGVERGLRGAGGRRRGARVCPCSPRSRPDYRHAFNRPGTDWGSFAVTWDPGTGRGTTLPNAIGPVAYSPDGKVLATGLAERNRQGGFRNRPYTRLALWTPGKAEPDAVVTAPTDPGPTAVGRPSDKGSVVVFAFHPEGKALAVASVDQLWWHPLGGKAQPVAELQLAPAVGWRAAARLAFDGGGKVLRLTTPPGGVQGRTTTVSWRVEVGEKGVVLTEVSRETAPSAKAEPAARQEVVVVSPNGATKATGSGLGVTLEDAKSGELLRELRPAR